VDLLSIVERVYASGVGEWLRTSLKAMPIVESIHVMAVALVFGTILIVDLRLIGFPNTQRSIMRIEHELLRWTWGGFVVSVITGCLLFTANAITYYGNTAFRLKMVALLAAGVNMAIFQYFTMRSIQSWDKGVMPPPAARTAGALSLLIWTTVIFVARWIGFTKGYDFAIPEEVELDFDFLQ